jgi:hypothetical protein
MYYFDIFIARLKSAQRLREPVYVYAVLVCFSHFTTPLLQARNTIRGYLQEAFLLKAFSN